MTNDYLKGHDYRMKTDANYRARHKAGMKKYRRPTKTPGQRCQGCNMRPAKYYHHGSKKWLCAKCHGKIHKQRFTMPWKKWR